ncbi:hypothetical protein B0H17DRAFT_663928 [Mycena rosella]|uniref:Uncharacterized protein n=1 Tax=Mycena rosella TaxID=1033263 RepID=A0AAD7M857_MYCRO|nr:hypothetical protein B0H17DRAFT_663928 [Mycena rosella]
MREGLSGGSGRKMGGGAPWSLLFGSFWRPSTNLIVLLFGNFRFARAACGSTQRSTGNCHSLESGGHEPPPIPETRHIQNDLRAFFPASSRTTPLILILSTQLNSGRVRGLLADSVLADVSGLSSRRSGMPVNILTRGIAFPYHLVTSFPENPAKIGESQLLL